MVYLDYAASSLKREDVIKNLIDNIDIYDGNPSSTHKLGRESKKYLEEARNIIAKEINANSENIYFTSGASESNNTILRNFDNEDFEIITTNIEHKSILETLNNIKSKSILLNSSENGYFDIKNLDKNINDKTKLISLIYVNNETGVIQPVDKVKEIIGEKDIWYHIDAVQALGHIDIDVKKLGCDSLSLSGHKLGGLNGFGVLYTKENINPIITGGNQERSLRAGTSNLLAALSMAYSIDKAKNERGKIKKVKEYFIDKLKNIPHEINGDINRSSDHIINVYFPFVKSDLLLTYLDMNDIYVSAGSACLAGTLEPSYVIENMHDAKRASHSVRFSFGFNTTYDDIDYTISKLREFYERKR